MFNPNGFRKQAEFGRSGPSALALADSVFSFRDCLSPSLPYRLSPTPRPTAALGRMYVPDLWGRALSLSSVTSVGCPKCRGFVCLFRRLLGRVARGIGGPDLHPATSDSHGDHPGP